MLLNDFKKSISISFSQFMGYLYIFEPLRELLKVNSSFNFFHMPKEVNDLVRNLNVVELNRYCLSLKAKRREYLFQAYGVSKKIDYSTLLNLFDMYHSLFPRRSGDTLVDDIYYFGKFCWDFLESNIEYYILKNMILFETNLFIQKQKKSPEISPNLVVKDSLRPVINSDVIIESFSFPIFHTYEYMNDHTSLDEYQLLDLPQKESHYVFLPAYLGEDSAVLHITNEVVLLCSLCNGLNTVVDMMSYFKCSDNKSHFLSLLESCIQDFEERGILYA